MTKTDMTQRKMMKHSVLNDGARRALWAIALLAPVAAHCAGDAQPAAATARLRDPQIEQGRYLVKIGGCNDCHTPGYGQSGGQIPEPEWLVGDRLGFSGPWGTTYPGNLRLLVAKMNEQQWLALTQHQQLRPPMPWFNLQAMKQSDLKAIYRFIAWLGPKGEPAPAYLPPHQTPQGPAVVFPAPPAR